MKTVYIVAANLLVVSVAVEALCSQRGSDESIQNDKKTVQSEVHPFSNWKIAQPPLPPAKTNHADNEKNHQEKSEKRERPYTSSIPYAMTWLSLEMEKYVKQQKNWVAYQKIVDKGATSQNTLHAACVVSEFEIQFDSHTLKAYMGAVIDRPDGVWQIAYTQVQSEPKQPIAEPKCVRIPSCKEAHCESDKERYEIRPQ